MNEKKVCFISSTGGHFEQLMQLKGVAKKYNHYYVLPKSKNFISFEEKKYLLVGVSRKNKFFAIYSYAISFIQQILVFLKEQPDVVITTGAGFAVPTCVIAHMLRKRVIYIESFARMKSLNKSGKLIYKFADLFIVQWKELLKEYPKAVYGGWIY